MNKTALVLSGGGFRGAFQVGAVKALLENWEKLEPESDGNTFDIVSGVSVGALNGLLIAQNKLEDLIEIWNEIGRKGLEAIYRSELLQTNIDQQSDNPAMKYRLSWRTLKKYFPETTHNILLKAIFSRESIFPSFIKEFQKIRAIADNTPLLEKVRKYARREAFGECIYKCGFVSLETGGYYSVNACDYLSDEDFAKGVIASTTMPIIWPPVDRINVRGRQYRQCVDGGVRSVSPLRYIIEDIKNDASPGDYTIIIINCSTGVLKEESFLRKNIAEIALRALDDIAITEIFNNDIRDFVTKNDFVLQVKEQHPDETVYDYDFENRKRGKPLFFFKSIVIQPDDNMLLGSPIAANARQIKERMEYGSQKAIEALNIYLKDNR